MKQDYQLGQWVTFKTEYGDVRGKITKVEETLTGVTYTFTTEDGQLGYING